MAMKLVALLLAGFTAIYPNAGKIQDVDVKNDLVTVQDVSGDLWQFFGVEDWEIGDKCAMLMDDQGTENIYDDVIVSVRYLGY